jgi:hypothetical protein
MTSMHIIIQGKEINSPPLASSTKRREKKKERYNKLHILWLATSEQKQVMTIKCKFFFDKSF